MTAGSRSPTPGRAPARRRQRERTTPIAVRVRLIWQRDGDEFLDTIAVGWAGQLVHVQIRDLRVRIGFAWLHAEHAEHVERR